MKASRWRSPFSAWVCTSCEARLQAKQLSRPAHSRKYASWNQKSKLPEAPARTRFAPSPTGNLHLGSIRTALFNYLLAKRTKGQFLLRIEDTDQKRTVPRAEEQLYNDLQWAGLQWDEGPVIGGAYGPYRQSERTEVYRSYTAPLLASNHAYRCFCTSERLDELNRSRHEKGLPLGYDRRCNEMSDGESDELSEKNHPYVVRFKAPPQYPTFIDLVYGKTGQGVNKGQKMHMDHRVYDDPILVKSDGHPTYHFANVVDDHLMKITHVIRGSEWMSSTPLHVALYEAFGWKPPLFGHVPLLVDQNQQKLSKRNFNTDIAGFRDKEGIFPDALINFAALLGWSHQQKNDVMNLKELESVFDLKFTKGNTIVSFGKLRFLQEKHARRYIEAGGPKFQQMIIDTSAAIFAQYGAVAVLAILGDRKLEDVVALILRAESKSYYSPTTVASRCSVFFGPPPSRDTYEVSDSFELSTLRTAAASLCLVPQGSWTAEVHRENIAALQYTTSDARNDSKSEMSSWKKEFYHYLRWALLGGAAGPSLIHTMEILGREICVDRIRSAGLQTLSQETMDTKPDIKVEAAA